MSEETKIDWPLWKVALKNLRELPGYGYGLKLETQWFEHQFGALRNTSDFAFQMLELRAAVESDDGYYLQSQTVQDDDTGLKAEFYQIPAASEHQGVALTFEGKMRRYAARSFHIRAKTLNNPEANLLDADRRKMEKSAEIAANRIVLLRRERAVIGALKKNTPKLIEPKG
jgi:hypothetical protein